MTKERLEAIVLWMNEITAILNYQPDIPLAHKQDICNALIKFEKALKKAGEIPKG